MGYNFAMRHELPHPLARQSGLGMPVVIFILVVMTLLATAMVRLSTTSAMSIAAEVSSTRAFYAAESGAQWAMHQLFPPAGGAGGCFASPATLTFTATGLNGCSATLSCSNTGTFNGRAHFVVTSSGRCGDEVRQLQVGAKQ